MADNINFRVDDILQFCDGVQSASGELEDMKRQTDGEAFNVVFRAEKIIEHIKGVQVTLDQDRKTAAEVRDHNKYVLDRMRNRLAELERKVAELSRAYTVAREQQRAAESAASRISSSSPRSTGDKNADAQIAQMREKQLAAARSAAQGASKQASDIQAAIRTTNENISKLRMLIEETVRSIEALDAFIREIQDEMIRVEEYRSNLANDKHDLESAVYQYDSLCHDYSMRLRNCCEYANQAIKYGRDIAKSFDPGHYMAYDSFYIMFTDPTALRSIAEELCNLYEECNDSETDMRRHVHIHNEILQDGVIEQATKEVDSFCRTHRNIAKELQEAAKACKNADKSLRAYYELQEKML